MSGTSLYNEIKEKATAFVHASRPKHPGTNEPNTEEFRSHAAPSFQCTWGHAYFVSTAPSLQGALDTDTFLKHMSGMCQLLDTWKIEVRDVFVDTERRTAIVNADYHMTPKGRETVHNDIVWFLEIDGEGKVVKAVEYIDPAASGRLGELFKMNKEGR